jgi:hypothetical protein
LTGAKVGAAARGKPASKGEDGTGKIHLRKGAR